MEKLLTPAEIETRAAKIGVSIWKICRTAGVSETVFYRWRAGQSRPTLTTYGKIAAALEALTKAGKP